MILERQKIARRCSVLFLIYFTTPPFTSDRVKRVIRGELNYFGYYPRVLSEGGRDGISRVRAKEREGGLRIQNLLESYN